MNPAPRSCGDGVAADCRAGCRPCADDHWTACETPSTAPCEPGTTECIGTRLLVCDDDGLVLRTEDCANGAQCRDVGVCNPTTGACETAAAAPDGTACDEGEGANGNFCDSSCACGACATVPPSFGSTKPCRAVSCTSENTCSGPLAIGGDCYGRAWYGATTTAIAYTFATSSPTGTLFNIWMRKDAGFDGFIFTADLAFVPREADGPSACADSDDAFTQGTCIGSNWGPNQSFAACEYPRTAANTESF